MVIVYTRHYAYRVDDRDFESRIVGTNTTGDALVHQSFLQGTCLGLDLLDFLVYFRLLLHHLFLLARVFLLVLFLALLSLGPALFASESIENTFDAVA